jgi:hypothetical protein
MPISSSVTQNWDEVPCRNILCHIVTINIKVKLFNAYVSCDVYVSTSDWSFRSSRFREASCCFAEFLTSTGRVVLEPTTTVYIHILLDSYVTIMLTFKATYVNV